MIAKELDFIGREKIAVNDQCSRGTCQHLQIVHRTRPRGMEPEYQASNSRSISTMAPLADANSSSSSGLSAKCIASGTFCSRDN